ncbi:hypothetical protein ACNKHR_21720 [Shigella flexneri]
MGTLTLLESDSLDSYRAIPPVRKIPPGWSTPGNACRATEPAIA